MTTSSPRRPLPLVVAVLGTLASAGFLVVVAALTLASGGAAAGGVAAFLLAWGAVVGVAAVFLWRLRGWARGPVVAAALIHLASMVSFATHQPWAWAGAAVCVAVVAGAVAPASTRALKLTGRPG
ncbi:hypothetical protein [Nigerium sp.]|jgi:hypothetical protein|uniref:hypothetical protein n=1 Tax=Nigerium sp. TaxID=2042655 RepID=UPI003221F61D